MACWIVVAFSRLPDPRSDRGKRHRLSDIYGDRGACGGLLPHGIPSEDTFLALFAALDPEAFEAAFQA